MADGADVNGETLIPLKNLSRLELKPGDTLVFQVDELITSEQREVLRTLLMKEIPGHKVLVLDQGYKLSVISEANAMADGADMNEYALSFSILAVAGYKLLSVSTNGRSEYEPYDGIVWEIWYLNYSDKNKVCVYIELKENKWEWKVTTSQALATGLSDSLKMAVAAIKSKMIHG